MHACACSCTVVRKNKHEMKAVKVEMWKIDTSNNLSSVDAINSYKAVMVVHLSNDYQIFIVFVVY